ncbi:MAG: hypothetical protein WCT07_03590 [Candidatus Paceibacterota bacterium]|jgi:hypothetical protein
MAFHDDTGGYTPLIIGALYKRTLAFYDGGTWRLKRHNNISGICTLAREGVYPITIFVSENQLKSWHIVRR